MEHGFESDPMNSEDLLYTQTDLMVEKEESFVMQKVTKFEGIIIEKVFFSNKNIYGNLMLTSGRKDRTDDS